MGYTGNRESFHFALLSLGLVTDLNIGWGISVGVIRAGSKTTMQPVCRRESR